MNYPSSGHAIHIDDIIHLIQPLWTKILKGTLFQKKGESLKRCHFNLPTFDIIFENRKQLFIYKRE